MLCCLLTRSVHTLCPLLSAVMSLPNKEGTPVSAHPGEPAEGWGSSVMSQRNYDAITGQTWSPCPGGRSHMTHPKVKGQHGMQGLEVGVQGHPQSPAVRVGTFLRGDFVLKPFTWSQGGCHGRQQPSPLKSVSA